MDTPTHRLVNGVEIELTPEEVAQIVAEWSDSQTSPEAIFEQKVNAGYDTGLGWSLPIDDASRVSLGELRVQLREGLDLGAWTLDSPCPVSPRATDGNVYDMSVGQVRQLIFLAGNYYAQLVVELRGAG